MDYMGQALALAKLALGEVSPNPAVGAVIVKNGEIIGKGYTQPPGSEHAEIVALKQAGKDARGGVLYVTMEPCCHYGRTPPCTQAVIAAGIRNVHMSMIDPNPVVSGKGKAELEKAGIRVHLGEHEEEAEQLNEAYIKFIITGIPFITAKFAISLDGKVATRSGDSRWVSGQESRKYVHNLRYISDAVMTGLNTVLIDDPRLTTRCAATGGVSKKQPLRVIVDTLGRTPLTAQVFHEPGKTLIASGKIRSKRKLAAFVSVGAELLELPSIDGLVDLKGLFKALAERQITSVLVEGGGILLGSMFDQGLVDKVVAFVAPIITGGEKAKTAVAGRGVEKMTESLRLQKVMVERFGDDVMISGYVDARG